jgi:DNA-binding transcriptional regulator YiaG
MLTPEEIRALRAYTEMTQIQMAQLFRVRPADVIAWENGTLEPEAEQMAQLERLQESGAKKMRFKFN